MINVSQIFQDVEKYVAYKNAQKAGRTELTFSQWKLVRTPDFKAWFGDWEKDPKSSSKAINPKTGEPLIFYRK